MIDNKHSVELMAISKEDIYDIIKIGIAFGIAYIILSLAVLIPNISGVVQI